MEIKSVTLRAFTLENNNLKKDDCGLLDLLIAKLPESKAQDRRMLLNEDDPKKEEELISDFNIKKGAHIAGAVLRLMPSKDAVSIPDELFDGKKIAYSELDAIDVRDTVICKDVYYFMVSDKTLVMCWFGNKTIKGFQTYINWLLADQRKDITFQFTPKIVQVSEIQMSGLRSIRVQDSQIRLPIDNTEQDFIKKIKDISKDIIYELMKEVKDLDETILEEIISAELLIKFKRKPKEMTQEDYDKAIGAYMKPVSDTENITFIPKKGRPINGNEILRTKRVAVEMIDSGKLSESQLYKEMEMFIQEIK